MAILVCEFASSRVNELILSDWILPTIKVPDTEAFCASRLPTTDDWLLILPAAIVPEIVASFAARVPLKVALPSVSIIAAV